MGVLPVSLFSKGWCIFLASEDAFYLETSGQPHTPILTWHLSAVKGRSWYAEDDFSKELYKAQELLDLVIVYVHVQINLNGQVDMIQNSIADLDNLELPRARKPWENVCATPWKWVLSSVQVPLFLMEPTAIWFQASSLTSSMELNLQQEICYLYMKSHHGFNVHNRSTESCLCTECRAEGCIEGGKYEVRAFLSLL